ncbi:FAD-dependent oxidoreductase [Sulfurovum sp. bin170]|uniref:FAD-dependent oxidoreductase n=1 Tax=Sulfurovum sp. bin170 TaxID=2695268 RepID=UPI0013E01D80|nr:FAD-dependent oxidoreductase [Sulfurovum sp. bin170]NEW60616.1 FAD-dependent oxidoreductase [Sulfurovum sp. bin170]
MNIAIVGAGLVGRVLALNLLKDGHTLTLFEKDTREGVHSAGFTAAGMLAPFAELETAESVIFDLGKRSMELWKPLLRDAGVYDGLQREGTIITAHPQDMPELEHFITSLRNKVDEAKDIELLNSRELSMIEPELGHHTQAFYLKDEGQVDSQRFIAFSTNYLDSMAKVTWREHTLVDKIESGKVFVDGKEESFDWVFDARGLGAKEYFSDLRGVRGEVIWLESNDIHITRPTRLLHPRYKIYIVPRENGCEGIELEYCKDCKIAQTTGSKRYIIGASEIESEDSSDISVRSMLELLSAVFTVHPNFGEARVVNTETNCRPAFRDNLPRIENSKGLTRINGLYRHGYLLAPAIVEKALNEGIRKI